MKMEIWILMLMTVITVCVLPKASTLTCLQCNNVPQPRHCNAVTECDKDETCGIEEISNEFGEKLFNVGCMKRMKCLGANSTQHCIQCCSTDVCNHEGCGEIGYPRNRGPVCYNCPVHTQSKACHFVDICRAGEVCKFDSRREFDDMLFSSGCSDAHACKQGAPLQPSIVGRDIDDNKYRAIRKQHRSLIEHVCRSCCESDLCNNMCNGSISAATSQCVSNPCHHGQCYDVSNGFVCVCNHGYEGRQCDKLILPCASNPCMRGSCTNNNDRYTCQCPQDYRGTKCEFKILPCELNPCMHGNCTNENDGYTCECPQDYTGTNCETRLAYIQELTSQGQSELRLDLTAANGSTAYETYQNFKLGVPPLYTLHIDNGVGTAGDSVGLFWNNGRNFATYDRDDNYDCAKEDHGGWWYDSCTYANLNGEYITPGTISSNRSESAMTYREFQGYKSLKETKIMFRRV